MATISYVNDAVPISGLNFNPAFEQVLDTTPTPGATSYSNLYELTNNNGGAFNGFKVQFTSNVNGGVGDFTYANDGGVIKPSGTITGLLLRAPDDTVIAQVTAGTSGYFNSKLQDFYARLTDPAAETPAKAIATALGGLLGQNNVVYGSPVADHLTVFGFAGAEVLGDGGNDVIWSRGSTYGRKLVGGAGNDIIRVERGTFEVHGANADGTGGAAQTDTLEMVGYAGSFSTVALYKFSSIDVLRFVAGDQPAPGSLDAASLQLRLNLTNIGIGNLPATLTVHGSSAASPGSENSISLDVEYNATATNGVTINLSGWSFRTWNDKQNSVSISTNSTEKALRDVVTGTMVADYITTYRGDDTIRGGGGADHLNGGRGNDQFVFGLREAEAGEIVDGGDGFDRVLILADNNFSGVQFWNIEQFNFAGGATATFDQGFFDTNSGGGVSLAAASAPAIVGNGAANTVVFQLAKTGGSNPGIDLSDLVLKSWDNGKDQVVIRGTKSLDTIVGSTKGDIINSRAGGDTVQGNAGADVFVFDSGLGTGVDRITDFRRKEGDDIHLAKSMFPKLKLGKLKKSAFEIGLKADDRKDRILYDKNTGALRYDADGSGKQKAKIFAILDDAASLKAGDIFVI